MIIPRSLNGLKAASLPVFARQQLRRQEGEGKRTRKKNLCQKSDKGLDPIDTKKEVAKAANTSHDTVAKVKIINNQFGRRNLSTYTRTNLALLLEPLIAKKAKENQSLSEGRGKKGSQISENLIEPIDRYKEVAKAANTSHDTVAKVKIINKAVDVGKVDAALECGEATSEGCGKYQVGTQEIAGTEVDSWRRLAEFCSTVFPLNR